MRPRSHVLASLATACALACASAPEEPRPAAAVHARHGERIGELMRGLATLSEERLPRAMDLRAAEDRKREQIVRVADAMAESADAIRRAAFETRLDASARVEFVRLATQLANDARALSESAGQPPPVDLTASARAVRRTCSECHSKFRIPGVSGEE